MTSPSFPAEGRGTWPALLALHSTATLTASVAAVVEAGFRFQHTARAADGFALLQLEDSCKMQPFYLGELPLTIAQVQVTTPSGRELDGACQLMSGDHKAAEAIAVWDALLAADEPAVGEELTAVRAKGLALLEQASAKRDEITAERKAILAATKVDFQMMDDEQMMDDPQITDKTP